MTCYCEYTNSIYPFGANVQHTSVQPKCVEMGAFQGCYTYDPQKFQVALTLTYKGINYGTFSISPTNPLNIQTKLLLGTDITLNVTINPTRFTMDYYANICPFGKNCITKQNSVKLI